MPLPEKMRALVIKEAGSAVITEVPIPILSDDEVLIQVKAVAQNPTDWKHRDYIANRNTILGCDFSGIVVALGTGLSQISSNGMKIGSHVAGFVQGGHFADRGAFAEYIKTPAELVWVVPEGVFSWEEAATMGCGLWTAVQALYEPNRLGLVEPPAKVEGEKWVFVYGGSTSVGQYAIQLLTLSGYKVITVASPRNFGLVKSLGATAVFDYKSPDTTSSILSLTGSNPIIGAFDTIGDASGQVLAVKAFGESGKGKIVTILAPTDAAKNLNKNVTIEPTLIYTALGREFSFAGKPFPASPSDRAHMAQFLAKLPSFVKAGHIKANTVKLWEGGLDGIEGGLEYMKGGKVTGEKIVYRVA